VGQFKQTAAFLCVLMCLHSSRLLKEHETAYKHILYTQSVHRDICEGRTELQALENKVLMKVFVRHDITGEFGLI
jgi:hypothetical protein